MAQWGEKYLSPEFLGSRFRCSCGSQHEIPIKRVVIERAAVERLPELAGELGLTKQVGLVADATTYQVLGEKARALLERAGFTVRDTILKPRRGKFLVADEETADELMPRIDHDASWLLAAGAGTINDLTKLAGSKLKRPHIALATAASMNGYGSPLVSLAIKGIKTMVAAQSPVAIVGDLDVVASAPREMTQAGVGDMIARPPANADWRIASTIKGEYYCPLPIEILDGLEEELGSHAESIRRAEPDGIAMLLRALTLSSFSLLVAGTTAPGSGAEHLVSHLLDTLALARGEDMKLHGLKVGIGTVLAARLYEHLESIEPASLNLTTLMPRYREIHELEPNVRKYFGPLTDRVLTEFRKKCFTRAEKEKELRIIIEKWPEFMRMAREVVPKPDLLRGLLKKVGAPSEPSELGISPLQARDIIIHAREIRGRYTAFDLASDVGALEEFADQVSAQ